MLITQWCFSCCKVKDFPVSHALPVRNWMRSWNGAWPGHLIWMSQRVVLYCRTPCPVHEPGGVGWEGWAYCALGRAWVGGEQSYSGSFVSPKFYSSLSLCPLFISIITIIINNNILFQLSNHSCLNLQALLFFFSGGEDGVNKQLSGS